MLRKSIFILLLTVAFSFLATQTRAESPAQCHRVVAEELDVARQNASWLTGAALKVTAARFQKQIIRRCQTDPGCVSAQIREALQLTTQRVEKLHRFRKQAQAYGMILGIMLGSAFVTSRVSAKLPEEAKFLTILSAQVGTILFFILGAPIWEPISSKTKRFAYWMSSVKEKEKVEDGLASPSYPGNLDGLYRQAQVTYSINSQLARSILNHAMVTLRQSFDSVVQMLQSKFGDDLEAYLVDQIAESVLRMKRLFGEIPPDDPSVVLLVRVSLVEPLKRANQYPAQIRDKVYRRILDFDPTVETDVKKVAHFQFLLKSWFPD